MKLNKEAQEKINSIENIVLDAYGSARSFRKTLSRIMGLKGYSLNNQLLIQHQKPDFVLVSSKSEWNKKGISVVEEDSYIQILMPCYIKLYFDVNTKKFEAIYKASKKTQKDIKTNPKKYKLQNRLYDFRIGKVYDITSTDANQETIDELMKPKGDDLLDKDFSKAINFLEDNIREEVKVHRNKLTYLEGLINQYISEQAITLNLEEDELNLLIESCKYVILETIGIKNVAFTTSYAFQKIKDKMEVYNSVLKYISNLTKVLLKEFEK